MGAGGGGRMGGTGQVGGPFTHKEVLEKSSSDALVKEALIWQHSASIPPSPSPGSPMSMSGMSKKKKKTEPRKKGSEWREREMIATDPVSMKSVKMERATLTSSPLTQKASTQDEADDSCDRTTTFLKAYSTVPSLRVQPEVTSLCVRGEFVSAHPCLQTGCNPSE